MGVDHKEKLKRMFSSPCVLLTLMLLDVASGFQSSLQQNQISLFLERSISANDPYTKRRTVLFSQNFNGLEGDPLEDDLRRQQPRQRLVRPQTSFTPSKASNSGAPGDEQNESDDEQRQQPKRLVRPQISDAPSNVANDLERKAAASTSAEGLNMELKDPKERVLVRHATASSAYGVDDFKGKKKKIIRPWRPNRKKKNKDNYIGFGRDANGEELKVELKSEPKRKRLVMARTNSSGGNQDAAKALISGGSKADITAEDIAEEKRMRNRRRGDNDIDDDDDYDYYDSDEYADNENDEPNLVRLSSSIVREPEEDPEDTPNLVQLSSSIVREPETGNEDEPKLVRLSTSIVREPEEDGEDEPNLVRLESSIIKEPEKETEEELRLYTRSSTQENEESKSEGQRLVRAVPASRQPSSDEPKLVRPSIVKAETEGPKLTKPNIVRAREEGPKLVRPNVFVAKANGPKLVRANIQKEKSPEPNLVRPKISATGTDTQSQAESFMYGANASTSSPTSVSFAVSSKAFVKPPSTNEERTADTPMENLMYGATQAATSPTAVSIDDLKATKQVKSLDSINDTTMDNLMYGATQAVTSPTAVPLDMKLRRKREDESVSTRSESPPGVAMDSLMYGHQRATSSPTAVKIDTKPAQYVKPKPDASKSSPQQNSSATSTVLYPDGDKRKKTPQPRFVRASETSNSDKKQDPRGKRYIKPSTSSMDVASDWATAKSSATTTNPTFVKLDHPVSNKQSLKSTGTFGTKGREEVEKKGETSKKYVQPSTSQMNNAPDWDAVQPAVATSNPSVVNVSAPKLKNKKETMDLEDQEITKQSGTKKYVQPSTSLMNNAPDWDAVQPATTTSNPSVVNVEIPQSKENESKQRLNEDEEVAELPRSKKYVQPSTSLMNSVPDWNAVQPATTTSKQNPSVVDVVIPKKKNRVKDDSGAENPKDEKKYSRPTTSLMENVPDWDAVLPAVATSNPSVVNVDGINRVGEPKRLVRPISSDSEDKQNPTNVKSNGDEDVKEELPEAIAHAAGKSPDGWTPSAHFPSDENSMNPRDNQKLNQQSTMENYDPDALPRPTGVIPLTASSSTKDKTQLFRPEHALEPLEDEDDTNMNDTTRNAVPKEDQSNGRLEEKTVSPFTRNVDRKDDSDI